jgi:hypothetical protein
MDINLGRFKFEVMDSAEAEVVHDALNEARYAWAQSATIPCYIFHDLENMLPKGKEEIGIWGDANFLRILDISTSFSPLKDFAWQDIQGYSGISSTDPTECDSFEFTAAGKRLVLETDNHEDLSKLFREKLTAIRQQGSPSRSSNMQKRDSHVRKTRKPCSDETMVLQGTDSTESGDDGVDADLAGDQVAKQFCYSSGGGSGSVVESSNFESSNFESSDFESRFFDGSTQITDKQTAQIKQTDQQSTDHRGQAMAGAGKTESTSSTSKTKGRGPSLGRAGRGSGSRAKAARNSDGDSGSGSRGAPRKQRKSVQDRAALKQEKQKEKSKRQEKLAAKMQKKKNKDAVSKEQAEADATRKSEEVKAAEAQLATLREEQEAANKAFLSTLVPRLVCNAQELGSSVWTEQASPSGKGGAGASDGGKGKKNVYKEEEERQEEMKNEILKEVLENMKAVRRHTQTLRKANKVKVKEVKEGGEGKVSI